MHKVTCDLMSFDSVRACATSVAALAEQHAARLAQGGDGRAWLGTSAVVLLVVMWSLTFGTVLTVKPAETASDVSSSAL